MSPVVFPSYEKIIKAAHDIHSSEGFVLVYTQFKSVDQRDSLYNENDRALEVVKQACANGQIAENGKTEQERDDPSNIAHAYKTLRGFFGFALDAIHSAHLRREYVEKISKWAAGYGAEYIEDADKAVEQAQSMREAAAKAYEEFHNTIEQVIIDRVETHGYNLETLIEASTERLFPDKSMAELTKQEQAEVFADVSQSELKGSVLSGMAEAVGWAVVLSTVTMLLYKVWQESTDVASAVKDVLSAGVDFAAADWGAAVAQTALAAVGEEFGALTIAIVGFAGGAIAGLIIGAVADALIEGFESLIHDALGHNSVKAVWIQYLKDPIVYDVKVPRPVIDL